MTHCRWAIATVIGMVIGAIALSKILVHVLTEAWWFGTVDFASVFWTRITWQVLLWLVSFGLYGAFLWGNYRLAMRNSRLRAWALLEGNGGALNAGVTRFSNVTAAIVIGLIALTAASSSLSAWETVLKYLHPTLLNQVDPIFNRDISFYLFQLPLYEGVRLWLLGLVIAATLLVMLVYLFREMIAASSEGVQVLGGAKAHLSLLGGAIALLVAWSFWLARYQLLYARGTVVFGASYTDVHVRVLADLILSLLALGLAFLCFVSMHRRSFRLLVRGLMLWIGAFIILNGVAPWFVQQFIVTPNELAKETPYIEHNIRMTQAAYHLDDVQQADYGAIAQLTRQSLQTNQSTLRNIRLWDYRPLLSTYKQLQEIRLYYNFADVDIDRYTLNGEYQQVMLSARELAYDQVPQAAQTWVNQRLKYTHGYGLVMSPVNRATADGLPELYIKDIPPVSQVDLSLQQPAIYYGEATHSYIFTGTSTDEFDYPSGDANASTRYHGAGGVALPSVWHRAAYAYDLGSIQILISNYLTAQTRIHYYRQILERVSHVAPFLRFDPDPYLVVIDGRLQWLLDAYTVSDRYPYSQPIAPTFHQGQNQPGEQGLATHAALNYIRNSVKVLIDAYDGSLRFFVVDEADPVLATYRAIFPHLFEPAAAIPPPVKAHFRYPEALFNIQAHLYQTYHMSTPEVFYNREDLWQVPRQVYEGNEVAMEPYYVVMRLPGEDQVGFILIQPFTPANKDNMIAWMAARSNGQDYGKLLLYQFPKQTLIYGPRQIEARIDQDPHISQQFTLWSQAGSKVIRGDLLVIPIDQSLLFVEPVYLRAEQGELPELKRVIVVYEQAVAMEPSLGQALDAIFGGEVGDRPTPSATDGTVTNLARSALAAYRNAQDALRQGNWSDYGRYQQELEQILQQLAQ